MITTYLAKHSLMGIDLHQRTAAAKPWTANPQDLYLILQIAGFDDRIDVGQ
jgi:hypothetical protein